MLPNERLCEINNVTSRVNNVTSRGGDYDWDDDYKNNNLSKDLPKIILALILLVFGAAWTYTFNAETHIDASQQMFFPNATRSSLGIIETQGGGVTNFVANAVDPYFEPYVLSNLIEIFYQSHV